MCHQWTQLAVSESLSRKTLLNNINKFFGEINSRYEPLSKDYQKKTESNQNCLIVNNIEAPDKLKARKSNVPGALPARFLKYASIIITPYLLNFSYTTNTIPSEWKKGYITPVLKETTNIAIDTLRPITQTNLYVKIMEGFMFHELYSQIIGKLNLSHYGAIRKFA